MLSEQVRKDREVFIEELLSGHYSTYFIASHPKYAAKAKSNFEAAFRFTPEPVSIAVPYMWKYTDARQKLLRLSELLTPEEAGTERTQHHRGNDTHLAHADVRQPVAASA